MWAIDAQYGSLSSLHRMTEIFSPDTKGLEGEGGKRAEHDSGDSDATISPNAIAVFRVSGRSRATRATTGKSTSVLAGMQ